LKAGKNPRVWRALKPLLLKACCSVNGGLAREEVGSFKPEDSAGKHIASKN
jgi:hypothetical protein